MTVTVLCLGVKREQKGKPWEVAFGPPTTHDPQKPSLWDQGFKLWVPPSPMNPNPDQPPVVPGRTYTLTVT